MLETFGTNYFTGISGRNDHPVKEIMLWSLLHRKLNIFWTILRVSKVSQPVLATEGVEEGIYCTTVNRQG